MGNKVQIVIEAINKAQGALDDIKRQFGGIENAAKGAAVGTSLLDRNMAGMVGTVLSVTAAIAGLKTAIQSSIKYLSGIETATLGIATAYMTGGQYIDSVTGKALAGQEALAAAQDDAKKAVEELKFENLQTIATLDELVQAYQITLPVAISKGFDKKQAKDFTVAMVQAAGAIGIAMNQLGEETRSLLTANIDPRNSRIATVLGLRNEDINKFKGNADALFTFLMDKLSAYRIAGIESQNTWAGLWSNFKDIGSQTLGQVFEPLFQALKYELKNIADGIVTIDEKARQIKWNPEFLGTIDTFRHGIASVIAEVYRLGMLLDRIGGTISTLKAGAHGAKSWLGDLPRRALALGSKVTESVSPEEQKALRDNDEYRRRYMEKEKGLLALAMREHGFKPITAEIDKKIKDAAAKGKKLYDLTSETIGDESEGTLQTLRYYRDKGAGAGADWKSNPKKPGNDKKAESLTKQWKDHESMYDEAIATAGMPKELREMGRILAQAEKARRKFGTVPGATDKIDRKEAAEMQAAMDTYDLDIAKEKERLDKEKIDNEKKLYDGMQKRYDFLKDRSVLTNELDLNEATRKRSQYLITEKELQDAEITSIRNLIAIEKERYDGYDVNYDADKMQAALDNIRKLEDRIKTMEATPVSVFGKISLSMRKLSDDAQDMGKNLSDVFTRAFNDMASALADFVTTGKADFSSLANAIIKDLIRIQIQAAATQGFNALKSVNWGSLFSGSSSTAGSNMAGTTGGGQTMVQSALGNIFSGGRLVPFAKGGVVYRPTVFPMANGAGLMGEAGPEAVMPLTRLPGGKLGVQSAGGNVNIAVELINESGQPMQATKSETRFDGERYIVTTWLAALDRNAYGLRSVLGG